ncbi:MbtH family NRPS accessory protein [Kitasatospora sp. NPDC049258]|uniref:MbtH family protein n=1 Tax=Kitasatospora sp. NPDC049258 TaxID=3155394 RepID=UPI00341DD034
MAEEAADTRSYLVVLNDEEQYSIWLADRELPLGWRSEGTRGSREECLAHIGAVWTDMRPLSLRRRMDSGAIGGAHASA